MKPVSPVREATIRMAAGIAILTALTEVVYVILAIALPPLTYTWRFTVGNIFMAGIMVLNFHMMAHTMYAAVDGGDSEGAQRQIRFSHTVRSIMVVLALVACFMFGYGVRPESTFRYESGIAACISVLYPQITAFSLQLFHRGEDPATAAPAPDISADTDAPDAPEGPAGEEPTEPPADGTEAP